MRHRTAVVSSFAGSSWHKSSRGQSTTQLRERREDSEEREGDWTAREHPETERSPRRGPRSRRSRSTSSLAVVRAAVPSSVPPRPGSDLAGSGQETQWLVKGGDGMGAGTEPKGVTAVGEDEDGGGKEEKAAAVSCSICLDAVVAAGGERSTARLQCGHEFHLDCIGSAFNAKGIMQCPNCRKVEKGNWLYANGSRPAQDVNMDEWAHDEDLYDVSYSEMFDPVNLPDAR
ncbi:hypothetical protein PR202_gb24827 [Eleusine coracana subsp. coracana]|uniref:RING-type domain-containing protein n=1 Tax=Eleusine coracana subsp. coracana TaxID=191504 RepID=A0AAV5FME1_ELECO|nr:hypothetical protein PR202_gb24827 [Eleusine coracana subsp. coracana]